MADPITLYGLSSTGVVTYSGTATTNTATWISEPYSPGDYITYNPVYLGIVRDYVPKPKPKLDPWMVMDEGL